MMDFGKPSLLLKEKRKQIGLPYLGRLAENSKYGI
jgi:hypothetical protein